MITGLSPEQYRRFSAVVDELLDLPPSERRAVLERACGDDGDLRARVIAFLEASGNLGGYLETPAGEVLPGALELLAGNDRTPPSPTPGGLRIGPYTTIREIERAAGGVLYLAHRDEDSAAWPAVLKLFDDPPSGEPDRVEQHRASPAIEHPGIAAPLEEGRSEEGRRWLASDFVEGVPITAHCRERGLTVGETLDLCLQALEAIGHLHRHGVAHGDLKPSAILVTAQGQPRIVGFEPGRDGATPVSDVAALGIVLLELLTGRRPWLVDGRNLSSVDRAALPSDLSGLDGRLRAVVRKALEEDRAQRFPSAEEMAGSIRRILAEGGGRRHRGWLARFLRRASPSL